MKGKATAAQAQSQAIQKKAIESDSSEEDGSGHGSFFGSEAEALQDGEDTGEVLSPFGPETFANAELCWAHAESVHGFSLRALRQRVGRTWSDYHRIRLVNHLRKLGPEAALREAPSLAALTADSPIWEREDLLMPVLGDDLLLFDAVEESESDAEEPQEALNQHHKGKGTGAGYSSGSAEADEVGRLHAEMESLKALLSSADPDSVPNSSRKSTGLSWQTTRALRAAAVSLQKWLTTDHELVARRTILNLGCGANVLGLVCAQLGAEVVAVDASVGSLAQARALAETNGHVQIQFLRGDLQDLHKGQASFGLACHGLLCERMVVQPSLAKLIQVLVARQRHLHQPAMGEKPEMCWVFPRRASLHISGGDFSQELEENKALTYVAGLNLAQLTPPLAEPGSVETWSYTMIGPERTASEQSASLLHADLSVEDAESIFSRRAFQLQIQPSRSLTSLMLELRMEESGMDTQHMLTVLHLAEIDHSLLCLPGSDFSLVEGYISGALLRDGYLQLAVALTARDSKGGEGKSISANFTLTGQD